MMEAVQTPEMSVYFYETALQISLKTAIFILDIMSI
jgi:hypothetical protein